MTSPGGAAESGGRQLRAVVASDNEPASRLLHRAPGKVSWLPVHGGTTQYAISLEGLR